MAAPPPPPPPQPAVVAALRGQVARLRATIARILGGPSPPGHAVPLPAFLRGGLFGRHRTQRAAEAGQGSFSVNAEPAADCDLVVGTIIKSKSDLQPEAVGEDPYDFGQGGDSNKDDAAQDNGGAPPPHPGEGQDHPGDERQGLEHPSGRCRLHRRGVGAPLLPLAEEPDHRPPAQPPRPIDSGRDAPQEVHEEEQDRDAPSHRGFWERFEVVQCEIDGDFDCDVCGRDIVSGESFHDLSCVNCSLCQQCFVLRGKGELEGDSEDSEDF